MFDMNQKFETAYLFIPVLAHVSTDESLHNLLTSVRTLSKQKICKFMSDFFDTIIRDKNLMLNSQQFSVMLYELQMKD